MVERPIPFKGEMVRAILDGRKTQTRRIMKVQPWPDALVTVEHYHPTVIDRYGDMQPGKETFGAHWDDGEYGLKSPYGQPGDQLWVREACWAESTFDGDGVRYPADHVWRIIENTQEASEAWCKLARYGGDAALDNQTNTGMRVPPIHMPRWASRITLRITDIRVERLQDISDADAQAEGATMRPACNGFQHRYPGWSMNWSKVGQLSHYATGAKRGVKAPLTEGDVSLHSAKWAFANIWNKINGPDAWDENPWVWAISFERVKP
ncbi:MAG: hypothetical protein INF89_19310 [Roseomonas sp.]|nr:hypothetical protein [Roseomonas sp.]